MAYDRACIIKAMARQVYKDYGKDAYQAFIRVNPTAKITRIENLIKREVPQPKPRPKRYR
jgi:hypothetical protein